MSDTDDLAGWLRATLDRVEQQAKAALWAGDERWEVLPSDSSIRRPWQVIDATYDEGLIKVQPHAADDEGVARHIAFWDPARVLRLVESAWRMLDLLDRAVDYPPHRDDYTSAHALGDMVRLLAVLFDDQPGYRQSWRPHTQT